MLRMFRRSTVAVCAIGAVTTLVLGVFLVGTANAAGGKINNAFNGRCLDADLGSIGSNGDRVQLWDCWGGANQSWYLPGDGTIRNAANGRCLDADLGSIGSNGDRVQLWDCWGGANQSWY